MSKIGLNSEERALLAMRSQLAPSASKTCIGALLWWGIPVAFILFGVVRHDYQIIGYAAFFLIAIIAWSTHTQVKQDKLLKSLLEKIDAYECGENHAD